MEMHQIRYFLAVCSEQNFTRAAKFCGVSQPSLTRGIQLLETEFGGFLFNRERSKTQITELGEIIRPYLQQAWEETFAAKSQAYEFVSSARAKLRLGIMCTITPYLLIDLFTAIRSRHPTIELQIVDGTGEELERQLLDGQIDLAIYYLPDGGFNKRLYYLPLFREQMMIVLPPGNGLTDHSSIRIADLTGGRYVRRSRCEFEGIFEGRGLACEIACSSDRDDWTLELVCSGFGFSLLPQHTITHPGVVVRPLVDPEIWRKVSLVSVNGRSHSTAAGAFVHEVMQAKRASQGALATSNHRTNAD